MRLLLDTHLLLWLAYAPDRLPAAARTAIMDDGNQLLFSAVSIWEVQIKRALDRPDFTADPGELRAGLLSNGYDELPVTGGHALALSGLPALHRDPFDRMLIAQAMAEALTLMSADRAIAQYDGPILTV